MAVWSAIARRLLEQEAGSAGSSRIGGYFHHDGRDHPLHARWLGRIRIFGQIASKTWNELRLEGSDQLPGELTADVRKRY
jgi:hypothetical protein